MDRSDGERVRRHEQLLDDLNKTTGYSKLTEETLDRAVWITRFRRGYGLVLRQTAE